MKYINEGMVVRGLKNVNLKPFSGEEVDHDGRLLNASVNSIEGLDVKNTIMVGMDPAMHAYGTRTSTAQKIIQKGGKVIIDPVDGNPNHCIIFGLKLTDANNLFSN